MLLLEGRWQCSACDINVQVSTLIVGVAYTHVFAANKSTSMAGLLSWCGAAMVVHQLPGAALLLKHIGGSNPAGQVEQQHRAFG